MVCEKCRFWKRFDETPALKPKMGECRIKSPEVAFSYYRNWLISVWPVTTESDNCGEFEPK